jgi:hypothetical protein
MTGMKKKKFTRRENNEYTESEKLEACELAEEMK